MNPADAEVADCEVAIVGGGMVGASLALALGQTGREVVLIEAADPAREAQPSFDERTTALGNGARRVFETLGVWAALRPQAAAISQIHVSDAGHFGFARLNAAAHGLAAFGYTMSNRHLGSVLWQALEGTPRVRRWCPARVRSAQLSAESVRLQVQREAGTVQLTAQLAVAADGTESLIKQVAAIGSERNDYRQLAVVGNVGTDCPAHGIAYERFTPEGALALLPRFDGSYAFIWSAPPELAQELLDCPDQDFCERLQRRFGWRAGRFGQIGRRVGYPLARVQASQSVGERTALVGNAAQTLHPVAAQGFNLGLRDAAVLAELLAGGGDAGDAQLLARYAQARRADRRGMLAFTDQLIRLFTTQRVPLVLARDLGLLAFDLSPMAKQALSRLSWGFGPLPRLSRGLSLSASGQEG